MPLTHTTLSLATITFPEIRLSPRDGHKLRGYFGTMFREYSPLLHNHFEDGRLRYGMPMVQYKVLDGVPTLVGLQEGAKLLTDLFFQMKTLRIEHREYAVMERNISFQNVQVGIEAGLFDYRFQTLWLPLNQRNYPEYLNKSPDERKAFLGRILVGNLLTFFKGLDLMLPAGVRVMATVRPEEPRQTNFKDTQLMAFNGSFTTNAVLPNLIGLGKSVSRGFGTIERLT